MKFNIVRSVCIDADFNKVRSIVEDFSTWNSWSPWTLADPKCKIDISGSAGKVGHSMSWSGEIIGSGINTISSISEKLISYDLEFFKPNKSVSTTSFIFEDCKEGTKVSWTMDGSLPFFLFFIIPMMKAWIGMDYDRGLKMLKEIVEKGKVDVKTENLGIKEFNGFSYIGIRRTCNINEVGQKMPADFDLLMNELSSREAKHWISLYPKMNIKTGEMTYIAAISDENIDLEILNENYVKGSIKDCSVLEIKHRGSYNFVGNAWSMGMMYLRSKKIKQSGVPFEYYWNSPKECKPSDLKTSIYFPLKIK
jgi:predicted transcriptional regulator YdeE